MAADFDSAADSFAPWAPAGRSWPRHLPLARGSWPHAERCRRARSRGGTSIGIRRLHPSSPPWGSSRGAPRGARSPAAIVAAGGGLARRGPERAPGLHSLHRVPEPGRAVHVAGGAGLLRAGG